MFGYKFDKKNIPVERGPSKDHHLRYKGKTYVYGPETGLLRCAYENVSTETEEFFLKALDPLRAETSVEPYQALQEIAKEYYELMEASEKLTGKLHKGYSMEKFRQLTEIKPSSGGMCWVTNFITYQYLVWKWIPILILPLNFIKQ